MRQRKLLYLVAALLITVIVILIIQNIYAKGGAALHTAFTNPIFIIILFIMALTISILASYVMFVKSPEKKTTQTGTMGAAMVLKSMHSKKPRSQIIRDFKDRGHNQQEIEMAIKDWEIKEEKLKSMNK